MKEWESDGADCDGGDDDGAFPFSEKESSSMVQMAVFCLLLQAARAQTTLNQTQGVDKRHGEYLEMSLRANC